MDHCGFGEQAGVLRTFALDKAFPPDTVRFRLLGQPKVLPGRRPNGSRPRPGIFDDADLLDEKDAMRIGIGLFNNMVIQRTTRTRADVRFSGSCSGTGAVMVAVRSKGRPLKGMARIKAGTARRGSFSCLVKGVPLGGPYEFRLSLVRAGEAVLEKTKVTNVLVGDVWMLAGQSNMEGIGDLRHALPPNDMVRVFRMDGRWDVAKDPLHELHKAKAEVHHIIGAVWSTNPLKGAGLGVSFGQEMLRLTGVPQGLIASAHGATSMTQWDPKDKKEGSRSLYGAMLERLRENGGRVAGLVWHQGCSDAFEHDAVPLYTLRMVEFGKAVRRDFHDARLPVVIGQIGRFTIALSDQESADWNSIQEQQRLLPSRIRRLLVVPAIDLELDDQIHLGGRDHVRLGKRFAGAMARLVMGRSRPRPPIELASLEVMPSDGKSSETIDLVVKFSNVVGSLRSEGRPNGFTLVENGRDILSIYRVELTRSKVVLRTTLPDYQVQRDKMLCYGFGVNPYCNIVDEADRALPAFGPIPIPIDNENASFFPDIEVSVPLPWPGQLAEVGPLSENVAMRPAVFSGTCCWPPEKDTRTPGKDELHYFRFRFICRQRMTMRLLFGYDGPVKVFINAREVFADPEGTNPIGKDEASYEFTAAKGEHEAVFALCTNKGRAWGIGARLLRIDKGRARADGYEIVKL